MSAPDPDTLHPLADHPRVAFLRPLARGRANVEVGRYTYYDDPDGPERFFERNVQHHYPPLGDRLVIGPFCALATGVTFFMNGANHALAGFSTFPFDIFGGDWAEGFTPDDLTGTRRGDTVVGADVWIGDGALILPGVTIGAGAIIGARAVVASDIPPYAVAVGNPARVVRHRFDPDTVAALLALAWWDWPVARITAARRAIQGADLATLRALAP